MTPAEYITKEVSDMLLTGNVEGAFFALKSHHERWHTLRDNVHQTSVNYADEKWRMETLCAEFGYKYGDYLLQRQKPNVQL